MLRAEDDFVTLPPPLPHRVVELSNVPNEALPRFVCFVQNVEMLRERFREVEPIVDGREK